MESVTGTPLCFARTDLSRGAFSVDAFLSGLRRRVPLETISEDLRTYLKILQNAMMELINADYADFVHLSSSLVALGAAMAKLDKELAAVEADFAAAAAPLHATLGELSEHLEQRRASREAQAALEDRMSLLASLQRIQGLLEAAPWAEAKRGLMVDRLGQLFLAVRLKSPDGARSVAGEAFDDALAKATDRFQAILEKELGRALAAEEVGSGLPPVVAALEAAGRRDAGLALFIAQALEPKLRAAFEGRRQPLERLEALLGVLEAESSRYATAWPSGDSPEAEFVNAALLTALLSALDADFAGLCLPSDADAFHAAFQRVSDFARRWWRPSHHLLKMSLAKFSLPVYFRLRTVAVAERLDGPLSAGLPVETKGQAEFRLEASALLLWALRHLWSEGVYLQPLLPRFWDHSLGLIADYADWQAKVIANASVHPHAQQPQLPNGAQSNGGEAVGVVSETERGDWEILAEVLSDAGGVDAAVFELAFDRIWPAVKDLGGEPSKLGQALTQAMRSIKSGSEAAVEGLASVLGQTLSRALRTGAKGITQQYRWTRKDVPSEASVYLSTGLQPLAAFAQSARDRLVPEADVAKVIAATLSNGLQTFQEAVREVLESEEKVKASLMRLKKTPKAAAEGGGPSDDDKIHRQLELDLVEFRHRAEALLGDAKLDWSGLEKLLTAVTKDPSPKPLV